MSPVSLVAGHRSVLMGTEVVQVERCSSWWWWGQPREASEVPSTLPQRMFVTCVQRVVPLSPCLHPAGVLSDCKEPHLLPQSQLSILLQMPPKTWLSAFPESTRQVQRTWGREGASPGRRASWCQEGEGDVVPPCSLSLAVSSPGAPGQQPTSGG